MRRQRLCGEVRRRVQFGVLVENVKKKTDVSLYEKRTRASTIRFK